MPAAAIQKAAEVYLMERKEAGRKLWEYRRKSRFIRLWQRLS